MEQAAEGPSVACTGGKQILRLRLGKSTPNFAQDDSAGMFAA